MPKHLIIISGKKNAGKDHLARLLKKQPYQFTDLVYAKQIKELLKPTLAALGYDVYTENRQIKEKIRPMMQSLGTLGTQKNINFWIEFAYKSIYKENDNSIWINTDTRYLYELKYFDNKIDHIVKVRIINDMDKNNDTHASEIALDEYEDYNHFDIIVKKSELYDNKDKQKQLCQKIFELLNLDFKDVYV